MKVEKRWRTYAASRGTYIIKKEIIRTMENRTVIHIKHNEQKSPMKISQVKANNKNDVYHEAENKITKADFIDFEKKSNDT